MTKADGFSIGFYLVLRKVRGSNPRIPKDGLGLAESEGFEPPQPFGCPSFSKRDYCPALATLYNFFIAFVYFCMACWTKSN